MEKQNVFIFKLFIDCVLFIDTANNRMLCAYISTCTQRIDFWIEELILLTKANIHLLC